MLENRRNLGRLARSGNYRHPEEEENQGDSDSYRPFSLLGLTPGQKLSAALAAGTELINSNQADFRRLHLTINQIARNTQPYSMPSKNRNRRKRSLRRWTSKMPTTECRRTPYSPNWDAWKCQLTSLNGSVTS